MATTTNYSWTTPDDTALVKDGAAAIRTLGSSIDTTTKALNPSTTLGDIEYRSSTANTNTRLGIGTTGQVLTVSGGVPAWATASAGAYTVIASGSIAASATGLDLTSISASYTDLKLYITDLSVNATAVGENVLIRLNNDSGNNYEYVRWTTANAISYSTDQTAFAVAALSDDGVDNTILIDIPNYSNSTSYKMFDWATSWSNSSPTGAARGFGAWDATPAAINRITITVGAGAFDGGSYIVYGVK